MKLAVQAVLLNPEGQVLAVSRKDDHTNFGLVGGKVDPEDKGLEEALIREVKEETGLDVNKFILVHAMHIYGYMQYTYLCDYSGIIETDEPHVVKWSDWEEVNSGTFGDYNKMVMCSLIDMGCTINHNGIIEKFPVRKQYIWSYKPTFRGDQEDLFQEYRQSDWNQTLITLMNKANCPTDEERNDPKSPYNSGIDDMSVPNKFKSLIESLEYYDNKTNLINKRYLIKFVDNDVDFIYSNNKPYRINIYNYGE